MEPWDGPASITFTDGTVIGAVLDRNGLRPSRYWVTDDDRVIMASEAGVVDVDPARVVRKGRLQPGRMFLVDTAKGRIVDDEEIKRELAGAQPYGEWLEQGLVHLHDLPDRVHVVPSHESVLRRQQMFGYTHEELKLLVAPMARTGAEAIGSMGTDTPDRGAVGAARACCSTTSSSCSRRSPTRRSTPSARSSSPRCRRPSAPRPTSSIRGRSRAVRSSCRSRSSTTTSWPSSSTSTTTATAPSSRPAVISGLYQVSGGGARAARGARPRPHRGVARPSPRASASSCSRTATRRGVGADPVAAAHVRGAPPPHPREDPHPGRSRGRGGRRPRGAPHGAARRLRRRRDQPVPRVRVDRGPHRRRAARPRRDGPEDRGEELHQGRGQGRAQGDVEDGHLHRRVVHRRAGVRGDRPRPGAGRRVLHRHRVAPRRHRPRRDRRGGGAPPRRRLPGAPRRARPPRPRPRRRVPVAARGRVPPLQPGDGVQAPARDPGQALRRLQGVHRAGRRPVEHASPRCAGCSSCARACASRSRSTRSSRSARS